MCVHIYVCVYACAVMAQWEADDECFRLENWFAPEFTFNLWWVWPVVGSRGGTEKRILKTVLGFIQGKHAKKTLKWTWFEYFWGITLYEVLQKSKQARLHWLHCEWCLLGLQQSKIKKQTKTSNVCPVSLDSKYWQMHHCRRKRVNVLTRCMWSGKKDQLNNNQIGCLISLADQNHATKSHDSWFLLSTESNSNLIDLLCLWLWKKKTTLICLISYWVGYCSQKRNVLFILFASPLLYVPSHFVRLDLPQRLQGCFVLLRVTICCRWDGHVILLLTVVGSGAFAAQDVGVEQLYGGPTCLSD